MELNYIIFSVISVLIIDSSKAIDIIPNGTIPEAPRSLAMHGYNDADPFNGELSRDLNIVKLPKYSVYLIGFTMFFMLIAIVVLAVALYLALKRKSIFGLNANNKQYVRQESTGVTPLYNVNYDDQNKNNGSTLTVNSGIIEISEPRASDPITPTRLEDINTKVVFAKKALGPIVPKGQMDAICKEVLRKVQKSDSASFRDLNELLKFDRKDEPFGMKSEDITESEKENKNDDKPVAKFGSPFFKLKKLDMKTDTPKEIKSETENDTKLEIKDETKQETKNETATESENKTKPDENKDVRIDVTTVESDKNEDESDSETEYDTVPSPIRFRHSGPEPDQEMYDTVPNPMRYRHSGPERDFCDESQYDTVASPKRFKASGADTDDDELDEIPLYDLPPGRSEDGTRKTVIQMDPDSDYLVPISTEKTNSCYVNAKRQ